MRYNISFSLMLIWKDRCKSKNKRVLFPNKLFVCVYVICNYSRSMQRFSVYKYLTRFSEGNTNTFFADEQVFSWSVTFPNNNLAFEVMENLFLTCQKVANSLIFCSWQGQNWKLENDSISLSLSLLSSSSQLSCLMSFFYRLPTTFGSPTYSWTKQRPSASQPTSPAPPHSGSTLTPPSATRAGSTLTSRAPWTSTSSRWTSSSVRSTLKASGIPRNSSSSVGSRWVGRSRTVSLYNLH